MPLRIKHITIKPFMDINTMLEERLLQCCAHVGTQGAVPVCALLCSEGLAAAWPDDAGSAACCRARTRRACARRP